MNYPKDIIRDYDKRDYDKLQETCVILRGMGFNAEIVGKENTDYFSYKVVIDGRFIVRYESYLKKYDFSTNAIYEYIDPYTQRTTAESLKVPKPKNVGVLTRKKVEDWIFYLTALDVEKKIESDKRKEAVRVYLEKVKSLPNIDIHKEDNGDIRIRSERGGILYRGEVDKNTGYISEKIEFLWTTGSKIEDFMKLSDNNY